MKKITICIYNLDELGEAAKKTAIERFRDINVRHNWYEAVYLDFIAIAQTIGLKFSGRDMEFSGFYTQGSGSAFAAEVDLLALIDGIVAKSWKSYAPKLELPLAPPRIDRRVMRLIRRRDLMPVANIARSGRGLSVFGSLEYGLPNHKGYERISGEMNRLEDWLQSVADSMNRYLYKSLERDYEYLTGDGAIEETIIANEYHFTIDGIFAGNIEAFNEENGAPNEN